MIIDTKEIENLIFENEYSIYEITQRCGITSRTSLNRARNNKKIDNLTLETIKKLQGFINEEEKEMEKVLVDVVELDGAGNIITVDYDINVGEYNSIKEANKAIEDDYSYFKPRKNTHTVEYLIYKEENDEVLNTIKFEV